MAEYDFRKDWMMIKAKEIIPKEIVRRAAA